MEEERCELRLKSISFAEAFVPGQGPIRFDVPWRVRRPLAISCLILAVLASWSTVILTFRSMSRIARKRLDPAYGTLNTPRRLAPWVEVSLVYVATYFLLGVGMVGIECLTEAFVHGMWEIHRDTFSMTLAAAVAYLVICAILLSSSTLFILGWRGDAKPKIPTQEDSEKSNEKEAESPKSEEMGIFAIIKEILPYVLPAIAVVLLVQYFGRVVGKKFWKYAGKHWLKPLFRYRDIPASELGIIPITSDLFTDEFMEKFSSVLASAFNGEIPNDEQGEL